jgi:glycosyltransferase involved in cell wall biosynthesis
MAPSPRVSVVLPAYNAGPYLKATIESALGQTWTDFELIALDNASTDDTPDIVRGFPDRRIRFRRNERNLGFAGNVNLGLSLAAGDHVAVLNADDIWEPDFLARTVARLDAEPALGMVHTACTFIDEAGAVFGAMPDHWQPTTPGAAAFVNCFRGGFCFAAMLMRASALRRVGPMPEGEPWGRIGDSWLFLRMCLQGDVGWIDTPLVRYRVHQESVSIEMYADGSLFRRHLAAVRDAFAWPEVRALGLARHRGGALRDVARESLAILPSIRRTESRRRFLGSAAYIVREVPSIALRPGTWARCALGLLPGRTLEGLRAWKRRRWAARHATA